MDFNKIIGHDVVKTGLYNSVINEKYSHAHLIVGEDGIGKKMIAEEFALGILGKKTGGNYVDILKWRVLKGKKSIGVDDIRELIIEINKKPYESDKKVVIIYEADKMTKEAQSAFLKTIEEPPKGVVIILLTNNLQTILQTIRSRCQVHKLNKLNSYDIKKYIDINYTDLSDKEKRVLLNFGDGIPGKIDEFVKDQKLSNIREEVLKLILSLIAKENSFFKEASYFLDKNKDRWNEVLNIFLAYFRDIIIYKETRNSDFILNYDKIEDIHELADAISYKNLSRFVELINETRERLESRVNPILVFDAMLYKMQEV
ncbi:DNA polymerase III subunit delta' [Clostridium sp. DL1XJH146]